MSHRTDILDAFIRRCRELSLINHGDCVLAAVSGGSDSVALLDLLHRWRESGGDFELAAAHFNHKLRPEADDEHRMVEGICRSMRVECHTGSADVAGWAKTNRIAIHAAARELRYRFLTGTAISVFPEAQGSERRRLIATGHQRDDQAETVLLRLFSGAGIEGMAGIRRCERWQATAPVTVIRPLLDYSRDQLKRYCRARGLSFATDRSNFDLRYPRVRIRRKLVPMIAKQFGSDAVEAIAHIAELTSASADFIADSINRALAATTIGKSATEVTLDYRLFISYYNMLRTGILQRAWRTLAESGARITRERLQNADRYIIQRRSGRLELGGGVSLGCSADEIRLWRQSDWDGDLAIAPGGTVDIPSFGRLAARLADPADCPLPPPPGAQYCDLDALGPGPYIVRPAQPGDRMTPQGTAARCRVTDLLRDAGISPHRRRYPVVVVNGEIAVIPPLRIAGWVKLTPATKRAMVFTADWAV
jgi:tRNA(Ile)-lysidine synthase